MPLPTGTALNAGQAVRDPVYVAGLGAIGCVRQTISFANGKGVEIPLGTLPANAVVLAGGGAFVTTAFSAGTTLDIGVAGTPTVIATALDPTTVGQKALDELVTGGAAGPATTDRQLVAKLSNAGALAAGSAEIIIPYCA